MDSAQSRYVSIVSIWEAARLMSLGRLGSNQRLLEIPRGFDLLPVQPAHCRKLLGLPQHHRDPFDRMMIAQAQHRQLPLLSDPRLRLDRSDGLAGD